MGEELDFEDVVDPCVDREADHVIADVFTLCQCARVNRVRSASCFGDDSIGTTLESLRTQKVLHVLLRHDRRVSAQVASGVCRLGCFWVAAFARICD